MPFKHLYFNVNRFIIVFPNRIAYNLSITIAFVLHFFYQVLLILVIFILLKISSNQIHYTTCADAFFSDIS